MYLKLQLQTLLYFLLATLFDSVHLFIFIFSDGEEDESEKEPEVEYQTKHMSAIVIVETHVCLLAITDYTTIPLITLYDCIHLFPLVFSDEEEEDSEEMPEEEP